MRKVVLFTASSLDGFIATKGGGIDWLFTDGDYGYKRFFNSIDTTLTGFKTYKKALSFGEFAFSGKANYVFSRKKRRPDHNVTFVSRNIPAFVQKLKKEKSKKNIWLVGGGILNSLLLNAGLIDEMIISYHPVILGNGIPLFTDKSRESEFTLVRQKLYPSGLVQITYKK